MPSAPEPKRCARCDGPMTWPKRVAELELLTVCATCFANQRDDLGDPVDG